jgi:hypothetical protein
MRRGLLRVAQRDPGIKRRGYERVPECMRRDGLADARSAGDLADDSAGAVPVQPLAVGGLEHRAAGALADGQVDGPGRPRRQRDGHHLAAPCG